MDHSELFKRMGVHGHTSDASHEAKRLHLREGGSARHEAHESAREEKMEHRAKKGMGGMLNMKQMPAMQEGMGRAMQKHGGRSHREHHGLGGDVGREVKGRAEDLGRKVKGGAEDVGRKVKGGLESAGNSLKRFFSAEGGMAEKPKMVMKQTRMAKPSEMGEMKKTRTGVVAGLKSTAHLKRGGKCK